MAEYEGFTLCLPKDMKALFDAEINSSAENEFQPAALGGMATSGKMICK